MNADKTKYMVMSRDHNAGRSHNIKLDNSSFERKEQFKYLGILTYQNSIQKEIRSRLTLRRLMSYIYGAPILDVSRSHITTQHSR